MGNEQPNSEQEWGAPQTKPAQKWSTRKTIAAAAIAAGVASAGGAAIYAAGGTSDAATEQGGPGGQTQGGPGGLQGGQSALAGALHGEYVVSDGNGTYRTELMQTGAVTEINSTSLTAKSVDGYTKTYTIDSNTAVGNNADISSIATGDTVTVVATVSGETATAEQVSEQTAGQTQAGPGQGGTGQQGTVPRREGETQSGSTGTTTGQG